MPRGGRRIGTPGKAYSNRSDLNKPVPMTAAPGQTYGQAGAQLAAQKQMPIAPQPVPTPGAAAPPAVAPGSLGPLTAPTQRPDEPLTAGAPFGAGPNSMTLPQEINPLMQAQVFLNQIPNLPTHLAVVRDSLKVQTQ